MTTARRGAAAGTSRRHPTPGRLRHLGPGGIAFVLHRLTGVGVLAYLYLHLVVLTQLVRGREAWDGFVAFATSPLVLAADVVLLAALLFHGLNGIRVSLVGAGLVRDRRAFLLAALAATAVVACLAAVRLFGVA